MKKPSECNSIEDVRTEIDTIDRQIIALLGARAGYVHKAAEFKTSVQTVRAEDRVAKMLETRKNWAVEESLSPQFIESLYRTIVDYFVNEELSDWKAGQKL